MTGVFTQFEGAPVNKMVRINANGTHDPSLVAPSTADLGALVRAVVIQPDGKIVIGGDFYGKIARLACE